MADVASLSLITAFVLGLVSFFLSVCILPLIPAYLTFIAGTSVKEMKENPKQARRQIVLNALAFVLGLAFFFALLGVLLQSVLASIAYDVRVFLNYFFGGIIILFGLMMSGLLKIPFLQREHKIRANFSKKSLFTSFIFGAAFAVGWTPCVSPFLGLLFGLAATQPVQVFPFMVSYGIGLGIPFLGVGVFVWQATGFLEKISPHMKTLNFVFGILFIILGILIATNQLAVIVNSLIPQDWILAIGRLEAGLG